MPSMKKIYSDIERSLSVLGSELERRAVKAALKLSESNKDTECGFCCAMGTWFFWVGDNSNIRPPTIRSIDRAYEEYGYNGVPSPVKVICLNGKIIDKVNDW